MVVRRRTYYPYTLSALPSISLSQENSMGTSNNPLAPNPMTDIDGPDVFPPIEPQKDLNTAVPVGEEGSVEERSQDDSVDKDDPL
jgi:hypothetical protein